MLLFVNNNLNALVFPSLIDTVVLIRRKKIYSNIIMSKRKTAYREEWEIDFNWLTKCTENSKAYCTICKRSLKIDNSGLAQVRAHADTDGHRNKVKLISLKTS